MLRMGSTMRLAWVLGAFLGLGFGCARESTSDYGVAAGFAVAAGVAQGAELAHKGRSSRACNPQTCAGCCDLADRCVGGGADDACGTGGATCHDCSVNGHQVCSESVCTPGSPAGGSQAASIQPLSGSSPPPAQAPSVRCGQLVVFCFTGTHPTCETDPSGCTLCSCTSDSRFDWTAPR